MLCFLRHPTRQLIFSLAILYCVRIQIIIINRVVSIKLYLLYTTHLFCWRVFLMHRLDMLVKSRHRLNNEYNTNVNHAVV